MVIKESFHIPSKRVLLKRIVRHYKNEKDGPSEFFQIGKESRRNGYFNREDFITVCMMKSSRPKKQYESNHHATIKRITSEVISTKYEKRRIRKLTELNGVSIPVASAILTALDPRNYGIIDIRVWQALYNLGIVNRKPEGKGFTVNDWISFIYKLRYWAKELDITVRRIEFTLFLFHRDYLQGRRNLYDPSRRISKHLSIQQQKMLHWLIE